MRAASIDRDAPVVIDNGGDGTIRTTWGEFLEANADAVEAGDVDIDAILATWAKVGASTYHGGGGAAATWTIRRA